MWISLEPIPPFANCGQKGGATRTQIEHGMLIGHVDSKGWASPLTNYHVYNADNSSTVVFPISEDFTASGWNCTNAPQPPTSTTHCDAGTNTNNGQFQDIWGDYGTYYTPAGCGVNVTDHWQWCSPSGPSPGKTFMTLSGFIHTVDSKINGYVNPPNEIPGGTVVNP